MRQDGKLRLGSRAVAVASVCFLVAAVVPYGADAQAPGVAVCGGLFGMMLNKTAQGTMAAWNSLGGDVERCVQQRSGFSITRLAQQCIEPNDPRIVGQVQFCQQVVQRVREQQQAAENARRAQLAAQEEAATRARAVQQAMLERQRQAALAAAAQAKAREAAHRQELITKYGQDAADAILAGKVLKGMTIDEVTEARGRPDSKVTVPPDDEMWRYGVDRVVFIDGKVTYVGQ